MHGLCYLQYQVRGIWNHFRCRPLMVILIRLSDVGKYIPLRWYSFLVGTLLSYKAKKESWVQTSLVWDAMYYQLLLLCLPYIGGLYPWTMSNNNPFTLLRCFCQGSSSYQQKDQLKLMVQYKFGNAKRQEKLFELINTYWMKEFKEEEWISGILLHQQSQ